MLRCIATLAVWLFCSLTVAQSAPQTSTPNAPASCRAFVNDFYRWYLPLTQTSTDVPTSLIALQHRGKAFSIELSRALKADLDAQAKVAGEIVGLDFDPFLGSQDPASHYDIRQLKDAGAKCSVGLYRNSTDKPEVVAELSQIRGRWVFANFRYPDISGDLLTVLTRLQQDRSREATHQ